MNENGKDTVLTCGKEGCHFPFARIQNGVLVIESRHHGESHVNVITMEEVAAVLARRSG